MIVSTDDLVERRRKYIQRQIELDKSAVDVAFRGAGRREAVRATGTGCRKLPVGQHDVKNWPVLDLGEQPDISLDKWKLEVGGLVENPFTLTWEQFLALPQVEDVSDFHCVTTWSRFDNHWGGVRIRDHRRTRRAEARSEVRALHRLRLHAGLATSPTPSTCRSRARSKTTCCSCIRGKASRCRASTAVRAA